MPNANPPARRNGQSRRWVFTLNNPTDDEEQRIGDLSSDPSVKYLVFGRERGASGTPHLQGFVVFSGNKRFNAVKQLISVRAHVEAARGTSQQAADYCKKDGDYEEFGTIPGVEQGKRTDLDDAIEWADKFMADAGRPITDVDVSLHHPKILIKYPRFVATLRARFEPPPLISYNDAELHDWQQELEELLLGAPDDRTIDFFVDKDGGKGKTWFTKYFWSKYRERTQILSPCKRDDFAYMIDETKSVFFINVPRGGMEFLQYTVLEMIKDRLVVSPKYQSCVKVLPASHVVVMCNEQPDMKKMSEDRFVIKEI